MMARMKWTGLILLVAIGLGGCGSDNDATAGARLIQSSAKGILAKRGKSATAAPAVTREALAGFSTPMIMVEIPSLGLLTFIVPIAQNGDVETWSTVDDKTISFRQGSMVATRGFGPDIMQATGPSLAQLASGNGSHDRVYYYLDGADQVQRFEYRCTMANTGNETVTVVSLQHSTRHVTESCTGKTGAFVNEYWFESNDFLRKSKQLLINAWGSITLQRVIDNG